MEFTIFTFATIHSYLYVAGVAPAILLGRRPSDKPTFGWLLLAPALGATTYLGSAPLLHSLGIRASLVATIVLAITSTGAGYLLFRYRQQKFGRVVLGGYLLSLLIYGLSVLVNGRDLLEIGLESYFPISNDDTFNYLGYIDQLRTVGWLTPLFEYPAGFKAGFSTAAWIRFPGVAIAAGLAELFGWDTHVIFFALQRAWVAVTISGVIGLAYLISGPWVAPLVSGLLLVSGNFLLHQSLQQFNSSISGVVVVVALCGICLAYLDSFRSGAGRNFAAGLIGAALGTLLATSPEAYPFWFVAIALAVIFADGTTITHPSSRKAIRILALCHVITALPLLSGLIPTLAMQGAAGMEANRPGDWLAAPGILVQLTGVRIATSPVLGDFRRGVVLASAIFLMLYLLALALVWLVLRRRRSMPSVIAGFELLVAVNFVFVIAALLFYASGRGFALHKLVDYFVFLPALIIGVAFAAALGEHWNRTRLGFAVAGLAALVFTYSIVAITEKRSLLASYVQLVHRLPSMDDYKLPSQLARGRVLLPDLHQEALNMFLYVNRWSGSTVSFSDQSSYRFVPSATQNAPNTVLRIAHVGAPGIPIADITMHSGAATGRSMRSYGAPGEVLVQYVRLHLRPTVQGGWIAAEGADPDNLRRWMSRRGGFEVLSLEKGNAYVLNMILEPGPDIVAGNRIVVSIAGKALRELVPTQLPASVQVPLAGFSGARVDGSISIIGEQRGPRQLRVGRLFTTLATQ